MMDGFEAYKARLMDIEMGLMFESLMKIAQLIVDYGMDDGAHHKQWLLDQILRVIARHDEIYKEFIEQEFGDDWDTGIAP